jgi:uncharacterized membrane protein
MMHRVFTPNAELLSKGKDAAAKNWGQAILGGLIYMIVAAGSGYIPLAAIIIGGALYLGWHMWSLDVTRNQNFDIQNIFNGFNYFSNSLIAYLLMLVFIFLWTLLLIIPGIIKALAYSQTFYILADEPEMKPMEALRKSEHMMDGNKTKLFLLYLLFMLLSIACIFTLGIGLLFLIPVMQTTLAEFYNELITESSTDSMNTKLLKDIDNPGNQNDENDLDNSDEEDIADWAK